MYGSSKSNPSLSRTSIGTYVPPHRRESLPPTSETTASTVSNPPSRASSPDPYANTPAAFSRVSRRNNSLKDGRKTYTFQQIRERIPAPGSQTFVQAVRSREENPGPVDPLVPKPPWWKTICRIMVHLGMHPAAPEELWTRVHNRALLEASLTSQAKIPLFVELLNRRWEFKGHYEITRYEIFKGLSEEVKVFIESRKESKLWKWPETVNWNELLMTDWARVELRLVEDQSLGNPMEGM
ncbi:hypothetical protein DACRYDRAFT_107856 [Dacryopinax primogenitus]|uniref:Uncharacterized protein n=1 Tax=Dacryopinax primogenitus (strain DJM 731) TaxID=1858805 RepID=M5FXS1_DACPD|nr:uncharacterized protein DACRYDRAFT_107856 [Dacryopinax primogenitus]EJU01299.1 hypothetical protein DACRYDRAFT_107856 [Dacryopinax primogenitus]